jgi:uncharacterized phage protein (TIGR01671 family)
MEKRIIKFRAWDNQLSRFMGDGEIIFSDYGETRIEANPNSIEYIGDKTHNYYEESRWRFSQFTGLHDKNGKGIEVYEGDIFEAIYKDCPDGYSIMGKETTVIKVMATVVFKFGQFAVEMMHPQYKQLVHTNLYEFLKNDQKVVIGNIYEHPHLIK